MGAGEDGAGEVYGGVYDEGLVTCCPSLSLQSGQDGAGKVAAAARVPQAVRADDVI